MAGYAAVTGANVGGEFENPYETVQMVRSIP